MECVYPACNSPQLHSDKLLIDIETQCDRSYNSLTVLVVHFLQAGGSQTEACIESSVG